MWTPGTCCRFVTVLFATCSGQKDCHVCGVYSPKKITFIFLFHKRAEDDCQNNWRGILNSESQRHREERERLASYIPTTLVAAFSLVVNSVKHIVLTF